MINHIDKKYVLNTYARANLQFVEGKGATLKDINNKKYIDFSAGIGVASLGHANKAISKEICKQSKKLLHTSNLFLIEPQARLAKKISKLSKQNMACFFANSGAEANEAAIKLARKYGQKKFAKKKFKIISLEHSFHGRTLATLKATGQDKFHQNSFAPYIDGFSYAKDIKSLKEMIDDETVAVMIELIQGEGGVKALDKKEVQNLAKFLKEKEVLLIVDEVQSGVYRSGEFLTSQVYGIKPDIVTLAKAIANGVPMGVMMSIHKDIFELGDHGSTFGGNFLSSSVALKTLEILEKFKKDGKLEKNIKYFDQKLDEILTKHKDIFIEKTGLGLMRGLRCKNDEILKNIISKSIKNGLLVLKSGRSTLRFLPPLNISKKEIDKGFKRLRKVLCEI